MGLEELSRRMSKYYETNEKEIEYTPNKAKIPTFNKQSQLPAVNAVSQSNNPPSVQQPRGNALDIAKQVIAKQQPPRQMGVGFTPIPQNPYAKKVSALPYNPAALQKAQQIQQQAQGKTAEQLRQQNLANIKRVGDERANNINKVLDRADAALKSNNWMGKISATGDALINNMVKGAQERVAAYENAPAPGTPEYLEWIKNRGRITDPTIDKLIVQAADKFGIDPTQYSPATQEFLKDEQEARERLTDGLTGVKKDIANVAVAIGDVLQNKMIEATTGVPYKAIMAATSGAEATQRKLSEGKSAAESGWYGVGSAGISAGIESLGGIGGGVAGTTAGQKIMRMLPEGLATQLFKIADTTLARLGVSAGSEGFEEAAEYVAQWAWESLNEGKVMPFSWEELWENVKIGSLTGGTFEGANIAINGKTPLNPDDYISGESYRPNLGENAAAARMAGQLDRVYGANKLEGKAVLGGNNPQPGKLPTITRREQRALDALSKQTGVNIQIDDDIKGSNGYFDRNTNTLHISRNSNNAVYQVAAHEITHSFESNPTEWNQLYEIANANLSEDARSKLEYVLQKTGYTDAEMQSEVVSHYVQQCVTDIKSFEQLVGVNRTLAQRIVDAFESFVRKLTGQKNIGSWQETAQLREFIGDIAPEQAQQTLAQMKKALAAGGQTVSEGIMQSKKLSDNGVDTKDSAYYHHGWAVELLTKSEMAAYMTKASMNEAGQEYMPQAGTGEYIIEFGHEDEPHNRIIFTDGAQFPSINRVIYIDGNGEAESVQDVLEGIIYGSLDCRTEEDVDGFLSLYEEAGLVRGFKRPSNDRSFQGGKNGGKFAGVYSENNKLQNRKRGGNGSESYSLKLSPDQITQNINTAVSHFGTTNRINEAGYLTVDGRLLDFSGKHDGAPGGYRTVDHRDIRDALGLDYGGDSYSGGMIQFMSEGNIRLAPESGGINLSVKPTEAQETRLKRYIQNFGGEVIVDFDNTNGDTVGSVEYPARTPASLILQEIRDYFDKGKLPEKFDYSRKLNREALQEMAERSRTGIPYAPGYVPKEARKPALPYNPNAPKPIPKNPAQGKFGGNTVGAAQPNPGTYANLQTEHGVVDPGENPARMIDMPKKDANGQVNSLFARTVAESESMPNEMVPEWEEAVASGAFSHEVATDKAANRHAERELGKGWDHAMRQWNAVSEGAKIATKNDLALGQLLLANAMKDGDTQTAMQLTAELCAEATRAGQAVQSFRLLKKMTPEGMLYYLQKTVNNLNEDFEGRKGFEKIKIDEGLAERLTKATTREEMDAVVDDIKKDIAAQTPVTWYDKWNAWRYVSMLGNPTTQVRNILGNALFLPVVKTKNLIATGIEAAVNKTGHLPYATKAVLNAKKDKSLLDFADKDFDNVVQEIQGGGKYSDKDDVMSKRQIFRNKFLEGWRTLTNKAMDKGDEIFSHQHYKASLAQYMKANNLTPENITPEQLNKARSYAVQEAQRATYRDASSVASLINRAKRTLANTANNKDNDLSKRAAARAGEFLLEGFVPFTKTPVNIVKRGIEYSPVGLVQGTVNLVRSVRGGDVDAAAAIDRMAAGLTGSGLLALGAWLASLGMVSGGPGEDDREEKYKGMLGGQDYALDFGDSTYTIDWLAPEALPFFTGVELYKEMQSKDGITLADTMGLISAMSDPIVELSMLSSMNNTFESLKYTQGDALSAVAGNLITSYLGQGVPTVGGKIARTLDETSRQTYYDPNKTGIIKSADVFRQKVQAKIPGAANALPERVDLWGRTEKNTGGNIAGRFFYNMLSPGYAEPKNVTKVDEELLRLAEATSDSNVYPEAAAKTFKVSGETIKLNSKQYTQFAKTKGQTAFDILEAAVDSSTYKKMTDAEKAEFVKDVYEYANAKAKAEVSKYQLDGKNAKIAQAEAKGIKPAQFLTITGAYDKDGNGRVAQEEAKAVLDKSGLTKAQKAYLWKLQNKSWKNNPYN